MRPFWKKTLHFSGLIVALFCAATQPSAFTEEPRTFAWSMIDVNPGMQGDAHLLTFENQSVLIDAGEYRVGQQVLLPFFKKKQVTQLSTVLITHPHFDHYGGLIALLEAGFPIGVIYIYPIPEALCLKEPWGCKFEDLEKIRSLARLRQIPVKPMSEFKNFVWSGHARLDNLFYFPKNRSPIPDDDINDASLIARLTVYGKRVLFTGDLNGRLGEWLAQKHPKDLKADILKFPHHGTEGAAPDIFFNAVQPKFGMIPSPKNLWCSDRSSRMRNWIRHAKIPGYVNGLHGSVDVKILPDGSFQFATEKPFNRKSPCGNE
ncbi:MBL fold metallo-hydrolase [Bdellovibrionota bacterium FG-1]